MGKRKDSFFNFLKIERIVIEVTLAKLEEEECDGYQQQEEEYYEFLTREGGILHPPYVGRHKQRSIADLYGRSERGSTGGFYTKLPPFWLIVVQVLLMVNSTWVPSAVGSPPLQLQWVLKRTIKVLDYHLSRYYYDDHSFCYLLKWVEKLEKKTF